MIGMLPASGWLLAAFAIALGVARAMITYATRHGLLDQPGRRRSHVVATPRGGGVGIVVACMVSLPPVLHAGPLPLRLIVAVAAGLALVAAVGWWDDHRSLPALPRFGAQLVACSVFAVATMGSGLAVWWVPVLVIAGTWSINLHNFMDGIDGILAQQVMFVCAGLAALSWAAQRPDLALASGCVAAASLGFWVFNRSPARIFMGDAGSGSLGWLVFALSVLIAVAVPAALLPVLVLSAAFVVDATLTLLSRIVRGKRWYTAHREHLYQWLARRAGSHRRVGRWFAAWNLLVVAPMAWLAWGSSVHAYAACGFAYGTSGAVWVALKRRCLRRGAQGIFNGVA